MPTRATTAENRAVSEKDRTSTKRPTLVYIIGAGHCGSTLLNLLLNGHDHILGLSEFHSLGDYTRRDALDPPLDHPFWKKVRDCYEQRSGRSFADVDLNTPYQSFRDVLNGPMEPLQDWVADHETLYSCVAEQSGARLLVDSSKMWQRLYLLWRSGRFHIKPIHLIRDGRAVTNSYARKYDDLRGAKRWVKSSLYSEYMRWRFGERWLRVYYEDLAARPEPTLRRICDYLNVAYQPGMLAYRDSRYVGIGGNRMRKQDHDRIQLDERWKHELSWKRRWIFDLLGGWLNKYYGYY